MFTANDVAKVLEIVTAGDKSEKEIEEIAKKIGDKFPNKIAVIRRALKRMHDFEVTQVRVISARELDKKEKDSLERNLNQKFGREHFYTYQIEKAIKAGLIIKIGDLVIDNSISTKTKTIKEQIINTAIN